jgi:hypothetical protein
MHINELSRVVTLSQSSLSACTQNRFTRLAGFST